MKKELGFGRIRTPDLLLTRPVFYLKTNEASLKFWVRDTVIKYFGGKFKLEIRNLQRRAS